MKDQTQHTATQTTQAHTADSQPRRRRLLLSETVRPLADEALRAVAGGGYREVVSSNHNETQLRA